MNPSTITMKAATAATPPIVVRRQLTHGLALTAICVIVDRTAGVPPGVMADIVRAWRVPCCTNAVNKIIGSPRAITPSAPGKTQSGSPITMVAARATSATPTNASA